MSKKWHTWTRKRDKHGNVSYEHRSGDWVVRKRNTAGYQKVMFQGFYVGPQRANEPYVSLFRTLAEAKASVEAYCEHDRDDPKTRIIQAYKDGNMLLCIDLIFNSISDEVEKSEERLEGYVNERLDNLTISR